VEEGIAGGVVKKKGRSGIDPLDILRHSCYIVIHEAYDFDNHSARP